MPRPPLKGGDVPYRARGDFRGRSPIAVSPITMANGHFISPVGLAGSNGTAKTHATTRHGFASRTQEERSTAFSDVETRGKTA